jgi:ribulose-5-phosphate 4-epimerase/fuculose-1-phosphate aldolase
VSEYIKFRCEHEKTEKTPFARFDELNAFRSKLRQRGLIGMDASGIGFGNLSVRDGVNGFRITGSGTGGLPELTLADYTKVVAYDFAGNWLRCKGPVIASSESLTHAAVYESEPTAGAVIHCHNSRLWAALLDHAPTTSKAAEYGTPELAFAVERLFKNSDVKAKKIFVMAGHEGGVVVFGKNLGEAFAVLEREMSNASSA